MKGWKFAEPSIVKEDNVKEIDNQLSLCKVKITKSLITLSDVLRYNGEIETKDVVLGSTGIGVVVENDTNLFGLEKGKRVYIEPNRQCQECFNCKSGETNKCSNLQIAGEDFDGFLADFALAPSDRLHLLPDNVSDLDALFINHISIAISIIDKLNVQKGDYVAVFGANNFGIILSQLLIYYQAVPILLTSDETNYKIAKDSGVYYVIGKDENWQKEVSTITGGRMTDKVVYNSESNIPCSKAFQLASYNAKVIFTGKNFTSTLHFSQAIKKQLSILCIEDVLGYTATSINLLANKAINLSYVRINKAKYDEVPFVLENLNKAYNNDQAVSETVIEMI